MLSGGDAKSFELPQVKTGVEGELPATVQSFKFAIRKRATRVENVETEHGCFPSRIDAQLGTTVDVVSEELTKIAVVTTLNVETTLVNRGTPIERPDFIEPLDASCNSLPHRKQDCWRGTREPQIK